tara:strand:- start:547 stop:885 length:339 start_codon:yes stop_codon:yes gene_type:complete
MTNLFGKYHCLKNKINNNTGYDNCLFIPTVEERYYIYGIMKKNGHANNIWTLIKEDGKLTVIPGYKVSTKRIGHFVTSQNRKKILDENNEFTIKLDGNMISSKPLLLNEKIN